MPNLSFWLVFGCLAFKISDFPFQKVAIMLRTRTGTKHEFHKHLLYNYPKKINEPMFFSLMQKHFILPYP